MSSGVIESLKARSIQDNGISAKEALSLYRAGKDVPYHVLAAASEIRGYFHGKKISLCGIVNAKSGRCAENCAFCAQSSHYKTEAPVYPLISSDEIIAKGKQAKESGAHMFGIVTSGTEIRTEQEWDEIYRAVKGLKQAGILPCASLGMLNAEQAKALKRAGLYRYHHNLETARSFFPQVCSTHEYDEDIETVRAAKAAGLSTCSGGIIGLGETIEQRIELAATLRELDVDSVPVNILNPIEGTPLGKIAPLAPLEILLTIALFRFMLPGKDIKLCGGKEKNLRQLLPLGIIAGANSLMTGNYLTTTGRDTTLDIEMISDLGLRIGL